MAARGVVAQTFNGGAVVSLQGTPATDAGAKIGAFGGAVDLGG